MWNPHHASFDAWRDATRPLLRADLRADADLALPRELMQLLRCIAHYRHDGRWELMTRLAHRTLTERRDLIDDIADPDVRHARDMERAVHRDLHKMHAFVRFRELAGTDGVPSYFAWFEPVHEILTRAAPFFVKRFPNMLWTIATPDGSAVWDRHTLQLLDAPLAADSRGNDVPEQLWRTYYRSICNVARINTRAMQREMPQRYWAHLPEAQDIAPLVRHGREQFERDSVAADIPAFEAARAVQQVRAALLGGRHGLEHCQRCELWRRATQAVPGAGPTPAALMLVGEQPGDEEDLRGLPFVGPAGRLLDEILREAGVERAQVFITGAVKHFKWEPRGKRRLHQRPNAREIVACADWLREEIDSVRPNTIVALGATALFSLLGMREPVASLRSQPLVHASGARVIASYHPAAILRAEPDRAAQLRQALSEDLGRALVDSRTPRTAP